MIYQDYNQNGLLQSPEKISGKKIIRVLYLEDNPSDVDLLEIKLSQIGDYEITAIDNKKDLVRHLKDDYDILICDFKLNGFTGRDAILMAKEITPDLPAIIVSGTVGEEEAVSLLHTGALDFVLKSNLDRVSLAIERAMEIVKNRQNAEHYLKELENKNALLNSILDGLDDIMFFKDTKGKYLRVNNAFSAMFGISESNVIGKADAEIFNEEIVEHAEPTDEQVLAYAKSTRFLTDFTQNDGKRIVMETVKTPIVSNNKVLGLVGISRDVTEKRLLEERLRRNQLTLSQAEEMVKAGSFEFNVDLEILICTPNLIRMFGMDSQYNQISLNKLYKMVYEVDRPLFSQQFDHAIENKEDLDFVCRMKIGNELKYLKTHLRPDRTGENNLFYGTIADITRERKQEDTINSIQEVERKNISRELHDGIGSKMSAAAMFLDQAKSKYQDDLISKTYEIVRESVEDVRVLSRNLSVKMVEENGLGSSVEDLLDRIPDKITREVRISIDEESISAFVASQIYRVLQEVINNMLKYAKASSFRLSLIQDNSILTLQIEDDGVGCDERTWKKGNGIKNVIHRVRRCHGIVRLSTERGKGCKYEIKLPVK